ncbi:MAG: indole-3-glycerol-phosphate synthase [Bradyrhizobiaceae bacterium]|nr:indole-3-glycerol-phosphate synthase [Bradyrhizobiaceae bacterium]
MKLQPGSLLKPFLQQRLAEINKAKAKLSIGQKQGKVSEMPMTRGFQGALAAQFNATGRPGVIAEMKAGSPFDNSFRTSVPYKNLAEDFEAVGATCLSVAVERKTFGGSYADLATVHEAVRIPLLAQDIIFDIYQILEARLAGGDAVMLPVALIGDAIGPYVERTISVALDPIVQVHTRAELDKALACGATCICVTNRNIHSFELVPDRCDELLPLVPADKALAIAEGGFGTAQDLERLAKAGAKAVLMGTALMKDADPAGVLERVLGVETVPAGEVPAGQVQP